MSLGAAVGSGGGACVRSCVCACVFRGTVYIAATAKTDKFPTISTGLIL